jgi:CHAD domain-containing protein
MSKPLSAELDPRQPYREAMRRLIDERWQDVWKAVPVAVAGEDPEGVHDVRVASRRLRAAMDVAANAFPASWYKLLHRIAKEITSELGEVRDRDVQIAYLMAEREQSSPGDHPGIDRLIARLEREREAARTEMLDYLAGLEERRVPEQTARRFGVQGNGQPSADESAA